MKTIILTCEFENKEQELLKKLGFHRHQTGGWRRGIWELRVYLMGSTHMYSVRYNNKRVYGPVTKLDTAIAHWQGLICDDILGDGLAKPRAVRLF